VKKLELKPPIIKKAGELNWLLGVFLVALGVAICNRANLGISMIAAPAFIIADAIHPLWNGFTVGMAEYLVQGLIVILACLICWRIDWRYLLSFLTAVIYGYVVDMWMLIIGTEPFEELWLRWVMLIVGDIVTCTGVAFFFRTYLPVEAYELFVHEVSRVRKFNLHKVKWIFDFSCLAVSIVLAFSIFGDATTFDWATIYTHSFHHIGLGTIVTTVISAPLINVISLVVRKRFGEDPLIKPIHKILLIGGRLSTQVDETEMPVDESVDAVDSTDVDSSKE
jgi:uncharacterized membrane protein YczE